MSKHTEISSLLKDSTIGSEYTVKGWVRAFRARRFIALNDGSTINNLQIVVDFENFDEELIKKSLSILVFKSLVSSSLRKVLVSR